MESKELLSLGFENVRRGEGARRASEEAGRASEEAGRASEEAGRASEEAGRTTRELEGPREGATEHLNKESDRIYSLCAVSIES